MAYRPILTAPDPRLKLVSQPVETVDAISVRGLIADMIETMYAADGIGLAAIQIGEARRILVMDIDQQDGKQEPARLHQSRNHCGLPTRWRVFEEGCLSVPEIWDDVERPARIQAEYLDADGKDTDTGSRRAAGHLPAARNGSSERRAVHRSSVPAQALDGAAQTGQGQAPAKRGLTMALRLAFMGTPDFAVPTLAELIAAGP